MTDIPQKAFSYTSAALGLASGFAETKGEERRTAGGSSADYLGETEQG